MGLKVIKIQEGGATVRPLHNLTKIKNFPVVFDQSNFSFFRRRSRIVEGEQKFVVDKTKEVKVKTF